MRLHFNLANDLLNEVIEFKRDVEKIYKHIENSIILSEETIENIKNDLIKSRENN